MTTNEEERKEWKLHLLPESDEKDVIEISRQAGCQSNLIRDMIFNDDDKDTIPEIPILDVSKPVLLKVIEFLNFHVDNPMVEIKKPIKTNHLESIVGEWDAKFVELDENHEMLTSLILAANYLDIPSLLELTICKLACMIKDKTPEEVKTLFNIEKDISPEEEKMVRDENPWIFEVKTNE
jgi:S-phase kinase-associated protein 1